LFGGIGEAKGYPDGPSRVLRLDSHVNYLFAATDLTQAYRASQSSHLDRDDNPYVGSVIREFVYIRAMNVMIVLDRLQSRSANGLAASSIEKTFLLHFPRQPVIADNKVMAENGEQTLNCWALTTQAKNRPKLRVVNESARLNAFDAKTNYQYRLEELVDGSAESYLLNVLQARPTRDSQDVIVKLEQSESCFIVTIVHPLAGQAVIVFSKGMMSVGGAFGSSPKSEVVPVAMDKFYSKIQRLEIRDIGPCWLSQD
jgi:hypothetical protein